MRWFIGSLLLISLCWSCTTALRSSSIDLYTLGDEVLVSGQIGGGPLAVEPSVAISDEAILVAWNDSFGGMNGSPSGVVVAWAISRDEGKSFSFGGYLPGRGKNQPASGADSWLGVDADGNFFLQVLGGNGEEQGIQVYYLDSSDLKNWRRMHDAATGGGLDKPAMAVREDGFLAIVYTSTNNYEIQVTHSSNGGIDWSRPVTVSDSESRIRLGAGVAVCGHSLLTAWIEGSEVLISYSTDSGRTFIPPKSVHRLEKPLEPPDDYALAIGPSAFIPNSVWVTCSARPNDDPIFHLAFAEGSNGGSTIAVQSGRMSEFATSPAVPVGESPPSALKLFPSIASAAEGTAVLYYDRRNSPNNTLTDVYLTVLGRSNEQLDIKLTDAPSDWSLMPGDIDNAPIQRNAGDYISLASTGPRLFAVWTDGRFGDSKIVGRSIRLTGSLAR